MSGTTPEIALGTAVDSDDTADYLTLTLADSLRTVDALFNNVTGHSHGGAHQGGPITSVPAAAIPDGSITGAKIADGSLTGADLADRTITQSKIGLGQVSGAEIADASITGGDIAAGTIAGSNIAAGTIDTGNLVAHAVTQAGSASGATNNPQYSGGVPADVPDMAVTLTTTGGDLLCWFSMSLLSSVISALVGLTIRVDAGVDLGGFTVTQPPTSGSVVAATTHVLIQGIPPGAHTIRGRWNHNAGVLTAYGQSRYLLVLELKR